MSTVKSSYEAARGSGAGARSVAVSSAFGEVSCCGDETAASDVMVRVSAGECSAVDELADALKALCVASSVLDSSLDGS